MGKEVHSFDPCNYVLVRNHLFSRNKTNGNRNNKRWGTCYKAREAYRYTSEILRVWFQTAAKK